ncbi:hypothetical protein DICVIV_12243 [Dictyocaulus viviparus]|uniref:Uncharacterized protein n=1 Tax=Dictyocaulus viviparus TaxID=29172 RepID=A0A0D8XAZ3_DICVI|nr:hypothetical protein DICVIV_12243 [Dictyocaulus viviparus]
MYANSDKFSFLSTTISIRRSPPDVAESITTIQHRQMCSKKIGSGTDWIGREHLKNLPPVLTEAISRLFTCYLSECEVPDQWKISKIVLLHKKGNVQIEAIIAISAFGLMSFSFSY